MKTPNTYTVYWEMLLSIMHSKLCAKCSAHRETPGRRITLFIFHVSPVCPCGKNLPYHERADKDTAWLPHRFPHVTGPTLHLPYLPHFSGSVLRRVSHCVCVCSCRSCYLDLIQFHAGLISSHVVVCAVKLFITLLSRLYHTCFLFYIDTTKSLRISWPFINRLG